MTTNNNIEPAEIEAMLPWYAAGTLNRRERQRVEGALRSDPDLARHADLVREELGETISLNESLGAPSAQSLGRLMTAIAAEPVQLRHRFSSLGLAARLTAFVAGFSPRTLAVASSFAVLAIAVQAFLLVGMVANPQGAYQTASVGEAAQRSGTFALVRFERQASVGDITKFLESYQATLVDGPRAGGLYRVKLAPTKLAKDDAANIVQRMQGDRVVEFVAPSE